MPFRSTRKTIARLSQPQYQLLKSLTDQETLDAAVLERSIKSAVDDRFALARGLINAARHLAANGDPLVRRSAISRAYYGAYHAARATVFEVHRRDEDDHEKLPRVLDSFPGGPETAGDTLKDLRLRRNEMDYSPYPGPDAENQYDEGEIETVINESIEKAENLILALQKYLGERG